MVSSTGPGATARPSGAPERGQAETPKAAPTPGEAETPPPQAARAAPEQKTPLPKAGKKKSTPQFTCPSCGFTQSVNGFRCPRCAVIFHLFIEKQREAKNRTRGRFAPHLRVLDQIFIRGGWWKVVVLVLAFLACFALALSAMRDWARRPARASLPSSLASIAAVSTAPTSHRLASPEAVPRWDPDPGHERQARIHTAPRDC